MKITFYNPLLLLLVMLFAVPVKAQQTSLFKHEFSWEYGGYTFKNVIELNLNDYEYYKSKSKTQPYNNYATEEEGHEYFLYLAKVLYKDAKDLKYNDYQLTSYLTAFVQSIPYKDDPYNGGYDYPKYPIETKGLFDPSGFLNDLNTKYKSKSIRLISLIKLCIL